MVLNKCHTNVLITALSCRYNHDQYNKLSGLVFLGEAIDLSSFHCETKQKNVFSLNTSGAGAGFAMTPWATETRHALSPTGIAVTTAQNDVAELMNRSAVKEREVELIRAILVSKCEPQVVFRAVRPAAGIALHSDARIQLYLAAIGKTEQLNGNATFPIVTTFFGI